MSEQEIFEVLDRLSKQAEAANNLPFIQAWPGLPMLDTFRVGDFEVRDLRPKTFQF
jgi:hypothetical protein